MRFGQRVRAFGFGGKSDVPPPLVPLFIVLQGVLFFSNILIVPLRWSGPESHRRAWPLKPAPRLRPPHPIHLGPTFEKGRSQLQSGKKSINSDRRRRRLDLGGGAAERLCSNSAR